jgi:molecular chaperone GrpE (heat shock protein)
VGDEFDPTTMDAVSQMPTTAGGDDSNASSQPSTLRVAEVLRDGYSIGSDFTLRPAKVIVAKDFAPDTPQGTTQPEQPQ